MVVARQPLTDRPRPQAREGTSACHRPPYTRRASERERGVDLRHVAEHQALVLSTGAGANRTSGAPCWRSCQRMSFCTAWGGTRSSSYQVSLLVKQQSQHSPRTLISTKAPRGTWSTPLPTNGGKWSSSLLAPRILALHLLLLLRREVVLDVEPNANLLGRLALDLVRNGLAGQVKQGLDVQVVRRQDQVEERLVINLRGGQSRREPAESP